MPTHSSSLLSTTPAQSNPQPGSITVKKKNGYMKLLGDLKKKKK